MTMYYKTNFFFIYEIILKVYTITIYSKKIKITTIAAILAPLGHHVINESNTTTMPIHVMYVIIVAQQVITELIFRWSDINFTWRELNVSDVCQKL